MCGMKHSSSNQPLVVNLSLHDTHAHEVYTNRCSSLYIGSLYRREPTRRHVDGLGIVSQLVADDTGDCQVDSGGDGDGVGDSAVGVRALLLAEAKKNPPTTS